MSDQENRKIKCLNCKKLISFVVRKIGEGKYSCPLFKCPDCKQYVCPHCGGKIEMIFAEGDEFPEGGFPKEIICTNCNHRSELYAFL